MSQTTDLPILAIHGGESRLDPSIRDDPFPFYRALRKEQPVYYDPKLDVWLVTRHADAMQVLRDDVNFSLQHGYQDRWCNGFADEMAEILNRDGGGFIRDPVFDPPVHTRYRQLTEKAFTAHRVKSLVDRIRQHIVAVIEPLAARGHGDGRMDFAVPMTARIMCEQLGFDFAEIGADRISAWSMAVVAQMGRMQTHEEMLVNARNMCDLQNFLIEKIRDREANPREDMTSDIVHARIDDPENPTLSMHEKIAVLRALLVGGNDTTVTALSNLMFILGTRPDIAQQLAGAIDDDRLLTRFVEEVLRIAPPTHGLFRTAMTDVDVGGTVIPSGAQVCIMFASANDDDAVFADPRTIDLSRDNLAKSLTFGAGIHRCVAAALARMEVKVAAQEIVKRLDNIQLSVPPESMTYLPTIEPRTLDVVPLTFTSRQ